MMTMSLRQKHDNILYSRDQQLIFMRSGLKITKFLTVQNTFNDFYFFKFLEIVMNILLYLVIDLDILTVIGTKNFPPLLYVMNNTY